MARLTKEDQLVKDLKDNIFLRGKLVANTMPNLNKRIEEAINDPNTDLPHIIAIYKLVNLEADKLVSEQARQEKEARDIKIDNIKIAKLRVDKKIAEEKHKTMVNERVAKENSKEVEEALASGTHTGFDDDEESIDKYFSITPENSTVQ